MAAQFVSASSQVLLNAAAPVTTYPFSVGMWVYSTTTGTNKTFWSLGDTGTTNNYFKLTKTTTETWNLNVAAGGAGIGTDFGTATANQWTFILCRFISSTSRRSCSVLGNGSTVHGNQTTARAPTGIDTVAIGCFQANTQTQFFDGMVAEYWMTNTDIQPDGAQLQDSTLRQLAYNGPFSLPHIAKDIIEYRSFRTRLTSDQDRGGEIYSRGIPQVWTNSGGVNLGPHPPAANNYKKPPNVRTTELVIV